MRPGDLVRVKVKGSGEKVNAVVRSVATITEPIEITYGGGLGGEPDPGRRYVPGPRSMTITLDVLS